MSKLKAGVIGAGVFGGYHAGKYAGLDSVSLEAVFDIRLDAAKAAAEKHGATGYDDLQAFLDAVNIVTIASPADTHFEMGKACLEAGKPILIEKPLAARKDHAEQLVKIAEAKGLVLAVDHQERAVTEAMGLYNIGETPQSIEAVRFNTWSPRGSDVSVTLDLMSHDIDLVCSLMGGAKLTHVEANGKVEKSDYFDEIDAHLTFEGGKTARLRASRIASERERWMTLDYKGGPFRVDFISREFINATGQKLNADFTNTPQGQDPLGYSVSRFVDAVMTGARPLVSGAEGLRALDIALRIDNSARS